jgi:Ser/Thr protein kinase RdoA (MazF antagonist)
VPAPILWEPELRLLITEAAAGPSLRSVLDENPAQARRAGAWLARLHGCGAPLPARADPLPVQLKWPPPLAELAAALSPLPEGRGLPTHGDFASADVLVPADGPTVVVDFDDAGLGEPALDVANFEATLELRGVRRYGTAEAFDSAATAFRSGYAEHTTPPTITAPVEAVVWLRLARRNLLSRPENEAWRHALARAKALLDD